VPTSLAVQAGDLIGVYRLESLVAKGGMGAVWQARHPTLDRRVAIKVIRAEARHHPDAREAFLREVRSLSRLRSPQTVQVIDSGFTDVGSPWMATEFLEGEDLRERIGRGGPLPVPDALFIGIEVLKSLSEAHALGIVHRDLKPGNVFLQQVPTVDGVRFAVKVLDFGVAKLLPSADGEVESTLWPQAPVKGSPRYMAPEQVTGEPPVSTASDLYAFGGMMYRVLSGEPVFDGDREQLFEAHIALAPTPLSERFPLLGIPRAFDALVMRCLAKAPADRHPSADALRRDLEDVRAELGSAHPGDASASMRTVETPAWLVAGNAEAWAAEAELTTPSPGPVPAPAGSPWVSADDLPSVGSVDMRAAWLAEGQSASPAPSQPTDDDALSAWLEAGVPSAAAGEPKPHPEDPDFAPPEADPLAALQLSVDPGKVHPVGPGDELAPPPKPKDPVADGGSAWLANGSAAAGPSGSVTYVPPPTSARLTGRGVPYGPAVAVLAVLVAAGAWMSRRGSAGDPATLAVDAAVVAPPLAPPPERRLTAVDRHRDTRRDAGVRPKRFGPGRGQKRKKPTVLVIADPGPARFARVDTGEVICPSNNRCRLEIDIDHMVRVKGHRPKRLSGDDLYDRRGGTMRVVLQPK